MKTPSIEKVLIIAGLILISLGIVGTVSATEKTQVSKETKIIVYAQKQRVELSKADVVYILSKTKNEAIIGAINGSIQTIRNCEVASNVISIIKARK